MKKLIHSYIFFSYIAALLLVSCNSIGNDKKTTKGDGNVIRHEVSVDIFDKIKVEGAIDVVYQAKPDEAAFLEVEADDNIIPLIDIQVKGKTLHVKARESINPSRFIVYTNSPSLKYIESKGASNITLNGTINGEELKVEMRGTGNLTADNLVYEKGEFKLDGTGNIEMNGQVLKAKYEMSGTGNIEAANLSTNELECKLKGVGNMEVNAEEKLSIEIKGTGSIAYKGNPQITKQEIKSTGSVKKL